MPEEETAAVVEAEKTDEGKDRSFTQEQVNSLLADQKRKVQSQFADYNDLKTKAAEYDKAIEAARTDQEKAVEAAKDEGRTEALTAANARLVAAEARAIAAEVKFRNPTLAVRAVDLKDVTVNDAGEVDAAAIKAKLKELSDADPYLIDDGKKPAPKPDKAQGGAVAAGDKSVSAGRELFESRRAKKTTASQ